MREDSVALTTGQAARRFAYQMSPVIGLLKKGAFVCDPAAK